MPLDRHRKRVMKAFAASLTDTAYEFLKAKEKYAEGDVWTQRSGKRVTKKNGKIIPVKTGRKPAKKKDHPGLGGEPSRQAIESVKQYSEEQNVPHSSFVMALSKGDRIWEAHLSGHQVRVVTGTKNGAKKITTRAFKATSVGRSNEKSPEANAFLWADKKMREKMHKDGFYPEGQKEAQAEKAAGKAPFPMLAHVYDPKKDVLTPKVFLQPKLDGVRAIVNTKTGEIMSRNGKPIYAWHVSKAVRDANITGTDYLDGELYSHGVGFQTIVGLVKRLERTEKDKSDKLQFQYHVYDTVSPKPFRQRHEIVKKALARINVPSAVNMVETREVDSSELQRSHRYFTGEGYEGTMIRQDNSTKYEIKKRSRSLLKVKDFKDTEYKIVGMAIEEGDIYKTPSVGAFILEGPNGERFNARPSMTREEREEMWANQSKYVGKQATVKYQQLTDAGVPRFPNVVGVRFEQ